MVEITEVPKETNGLKQGVRRGNNEEQYCCGGGGGGGEEDYSS